MKNNTTKTAFANLFNKQAVYLLLAVSGISFCFFLGFPFDNHNESYKLVVLLQKNSFYDIVTKTVIPGIETYRPLGIATAWLSYIFSGDIYLQQLLNWLFAVASFIILFIASKNKMAFSVLSFLISAGFFSGYIYLFHLHGVFYGPFQLYVALLVYIACKYNRLSSGLLTILFAITIVAGLYHTFALPVFCAFLSGYLLQLPKTERASRFIRLIVTILLTIGFMMLLLNSKELKSTEQLISGFIASYRTTEINKMLTLVSVCLAMLTAIPMAKSVANRITIAIAIAILSSLLLFIHFPVLLLWVVACLVKTIFQKNWVMAAMVAVTAILPLASGTGSPTYAVFVLMVCSFVTASGDILSVPDSVLLRRASVSFIVLLFICLVSIKYGHTVPVITPLVKPVLAEQEKTRQLKDILAWKLANKQYESFGLTLYDSAGQPVNAKNVINRINRPVTDQANINTYLDFLSAGSFNEKKTPLLYVTFGNKILAGKELVFFQDGIWNGKAYVFR